MNKWRLELVNAKGRTARAKRQAGSRQQTDDIARRRRIANTSLHVPKPSRLCNVCPHVPVKPGEAIGLLVALSSCHKTHVCVCYRE